MHKPGSRSGGVSWQEGRSGVFFSMKTILAPVDFSPATRGVVAVGLELARSLGGRVVLLHAVQYPVITTDYGLTADMLQETIEVNEHAARRQLAHLETSFSDEGVPVSSRIVQGFPAGNIIEEARSLGASYLVLGSHGHTALYDLLVGSTTHAVLMKAPCPVVVVPRAERKKAASGRG